MTISLKTINALESAIDRKIEKASAKRTRTQGIVSRTGNDGTVYAVLQGSEVETPMSGVSASVKPGDVVNVTVQNGKAYIDGNYTDPSAGVQYVGRVEQRADSAIAEAERARYAADSAEKDAERAWVAANSAEDAATTAWNHADDAYNAAVSAQTSAGNANTYANAALGQLSVVQDVMGVITWASEHGSFVLTQDSTVQAGKVYFTYDSQTGDYVPVVAPSDEYLSTYYELTVDEAMDSFIMAHLAVTASGLWVLPSGFTYALTSDTSVVSGRTYFTRSGTDPNYYYTVVTNPSGNPSQQGYYIYEAQYSDGYKMLLSSNGAYIYDSFGVLVMTYGENIVPSTNRAFYIGDPNSTSYILFTPASGNTPAKITIGGDVQIGSDKTLSELLSELEQKAARGTGILPITTAPTSYTTTQGGFTPSYRISLATVKSQAGVTEVLVGDELRYGSDLYPVGYVSSSYVYTGDKVSIQGDAGTDGGRWYTGTGITGTSTTATVFSGSGVTYAVVGDMYLNTSTYNTYRCTLGGNASTAKWVYEANIKGGTGADAVSYDIAISPSAIVRSQDGTLQTSSITLSATRTEGAGTPASYSGRFKIEESANGTSWTSKYTSSSNESSKTWTTTGTSGLSSTAKFVRCTLYAAGGTTTQLDTQTVPIVQDGADGEDAYTVMLTNEAHVFPAGTSAAISSSTTTTVLAYKGATAVTPTIGTISTGVTGLSASKSGTTITFSASTSLATQGGTVDIPVTVDGITFTLKFSWSLALKGDDSVNYYLGVSPGAIVRDSSGTLGATSVSWSATSKQGAGTPAAWSGYVWSHYTTDYSTWTQISKASSAASSGTVTIPSTGTVRQNVKAVRITLHTASPTSGNQVDSVTVPVVDSVKGDPGDTGPEAVVYVTFDAVDWIAGTATLRATLIVNGTVTTPTTYKWTKGSSTTSLGTSATLSVSDVQAVYNCTVTWSGGTQVGKIDLVPLAYAAAVAGNYIVSTASNDVWIHSEGHGPASDGTVTNDTYGWRIGSIFELVHAGLSYIKMWAYQLTDEVALRLGLEQGGHVVLDTGGMEVFDWDSMLNNGDGAAVSVAEFGKDGARLGNEDDAHVEIDATSMTALSSDGVQWFDVDMDAGAFSTTVVIPSRSSQIRLVATEKHSVSETKTVSVDVSAIPSGTSFYVDDRDDITLVGLWAHDLTDTLVWDSWTTSSNLVVTASSTSTLLKGCRKTATSKLTYTKGSSGTTRTYSITNATAADGHITVSASRKISYSGGSSLNMETSMTVTTDDSTLNATVIIDSSTGTITYDDTVKGAAFTFGSRRGEIGILSSAMGDLVEASGMYSYAEGQRTTANGTCAHAEGYGTTADLYSHAEGLGCEAYGNSHAEGYDTYAEVYSHAEGFETEATGGFAHTQNWGTKAGYECQTAIGKYNDNKSGNLFEVGNGTSDNARSNAFEVDSSGNVYSPGTSGVVNDSGWQTLTLESGWAEYSSTYTPKYRKVNGVVEVRGAISPTSAKTLNETEVSFARLPEGYRPDNNVVAICQGSGVKVWMLRITSGGYVQAARLRTMNSTSYQSASTSEWLIFQATFIAG